ncbi:kinesin-like protein KIF13A isoform X1 [Bombus vosnesenskii]|uniref:Kinesin-like protein KIF13A isoform X1 n=3 Tax=Pyrobombus TaxID=144703 RepID=A0A6J3KCD1_9HYME|nr:kinesin-like protein KIF13A isoform X1 [Bombus vancouverensis nearcticus]XP_033350106.1 kinesin-like protein KIF13A isoform X1 [Bombus vosnesenskii]XP_050476487.1 kinesin-like protein KIF13A isoform X1 [Bombus huntii]
MATDKIKVAVRVRPFNRRELELGTQCVVEMSGQQTILQHPTTMDKIERSKPKTFAFDHCFYSLDPAVENFANQDVVFDALGRDILDNAFQGYNACIFAYGQTGSGKSYTMMGSGENKGIIPRLCDNLFDMIAKQQSSELTYKVEVSYMEIYNEKVHDLLDPKPNKQSLKVREHNVLGPYVDGLSQLAVTSFQDIDNLMAEGNKSRTVAATNMNSESSRSHAVFSVILTQTLTDSKSGVSGEKVSRMSLVDLAGSERAVKTGAVGDRLKEGSNINKSLTTLGLVISKLADQNSGSNKNKDKFVPYRDSVLTWLLKDNLGGNSKTVMVATISPAADNYEETLSTLRYADRAKRIVNHAVVNEDPNARIIRELRQEVEALKEMLLHATGQGSIVGQQRTDITEKLSESERLMKEMSQTWEEKLVKTERLQHERQQALEKMGISVQASGIQVEKNKYYLVNLNDDPSLNELLVYYLKERTLVGGRSAKTDQDIQLHGLGILPEHCVITIEETGLYMTPLNGARCFVNGTQVVEKTPLLHGDRIVWGNHHFFRVNCPRSATAINSEPQTPAQNIDYTFAREELMLNELSNDPIQRAIARLEKQHEEDKQVALEKQRQEYERQFQQLRNILSPSTPYSPYVPYDPLRGSQSSKLPACTPTTQMRVEKWAQERDEMFKRSLGQLKADILKANALVQEANFLAEEMGKQTKFSVTLQIPPNNLSPNRKSVFFQRGAFVSEPAILVKRTNMGSQVWSMEKLENKLVDMRDMYEDRKDPNNCQRLPAIKDEVPGKTQDPFYESQENHNLIGVANIFLEVLFHDVRLDYHTPIISQQGEVAGRLQVEISRISGHFPQDRICEAASESSNDSTSSEPEDYSGSSFITCRVTIKQATGLPLSLSHFVFCQYMFCGHPDPIVVPAIDNSEQLTSNCQIGQRDSLVFKFNHTKDFTVPITEEFIEHCSEGALSIEVWGHRSAGFSRSKPGWEVEQQLAKARSLADRWSELTRKIELWVEIQELNEQGEYSPVDVVVKQDTWTGGIYQLRQGQQRRIQVRVKPVQNSGTLPIICQSILNIAVGSVSVRNRLQIPLDSYQDEDLSILREKWSEALMRRRQYLDQQIQKLINKQDKTEQDIEREQSLVDQWVSLTEERNAVLVPAAGSGIPGAPADWNPPPGMEPHIPVLFLDLNADDLSTHQSGEEVSVTGLNSILPKEHGNKFYNLPIIRRIEKDVCAIAAWDSSIHDNIHLNKVTDANERVFLILKTTVRLSHPAPMDLVLRKRLALNIYKRQSITDRIFKRIVRTDCLTQTGVTYEVVSNIPKASEELEDRESLAQIAASGEDNSLCDGETYIEKYTRGVSAVESILTLDRLRQSVAVKELLQAQGQPLMRKTASVPNFSQVLLPLRRLGRTIMRSDTSMDSLNVTRSESVTDLNTELNGLLHSRRASTGHTRNDENFVSAPAKPFGIGSILNSARPTFLNLNLNLNSLTRLQQSTSAKSSPNMVGGKLGLRMTTLHEETSNTGNQLSTPVHDEDEEKSDADYSEYDSYQAPAKPVKPLTSSRTLDSLVELQSTKINTPSMSSSGYGSQAVSTTNLTSEDSISVKSISVDETPDLEYRNLLDYKKPERMDSSLVEETPEEYMGEVTNALGNLNVMENTCGEEHTRKNLDETGAYMDADIDSPVSSTKSDGDANTNVSRTSSTHRQKKDIPSQGLSNRRKSDMEISQASNSGEDSPLEGSSVVHTKLPPGKVVRRRKASTSTGRPTSSQHRASFPMVRPQVSESKAAARLEQSMQPNIPYENGDNSSSERIDDDVSDKSSAFGSRHDLSRVETPLPDWVIVGESVLVRPYSYSGVIAYVGPTEFASGTWIGVELDAPTGKNDGAVNGHRYFTCRPKCGIFVKVDKLIQDKRGRALRNYVSVPQPAPMRRSVSRGEGLHSLHRSRSRGEGLSTTGTRSSPRGK